MNVSVSRFGEFDGGKVDLFTLVNKNGMVIKITNYGGTVTSIEVPDKYGSCGVISCGLILWMVTSVMLTRRILLTSVAWWVVMRDV